jgi:2-hydroxychromene-2-carboxylate isomerase
MQGERKEIKMYTDFKSPYAFLAFDPAFELERRYQVRVRWMPFQLRIKGKGQRSEYSEFKVRYSYMDARRWANLRGGIVLKGPLKIFDTTPALIGGLFAERHGRLVDYGRKVYARFFRREFEADQPDVVAALIAELGMPENDYREYLAGEGLRVYERAQQEAHEDRIFGVPIFVFQGEQFWGNDRIAFLERRLRDAGLALDESAPSVAGSS